MRVAQLRIATTTRSAPAVTNCLRREKWRARTPALRGSRLRYPRPALAATAVARGQGRCWQRSTTSAFSGAGKSTGGAVREVSRLLSSASTPAPAAPGLVEVRHEARFECPARQHLFLA